MAFTTLMYHEIREKEIFDPNQPSPIEVKQAYEDILPPFLFVTLEHFKEQMDYLKKQDYHILSLAEVKDYYFNDYQLPEKSVLLTFDDCYQSMKKYAYPILKQHGFHAVAFVVTGWLTCAAKEFNAAKSVCLSEAELAGLSDVFEYANHTDSFHRRFDTSTSILMTATDEEFAEDLTICSTKQRITAKDVFAYPFGLYEERNIELLKEKGFRLAFTSEPGKNDEQTLPLQLKRNAVPYSMELEDFKRIL